MTAERIDGPTPAGGDYSIAVWVDLSTMNAVDRDKADGVVITEYDSDGTQINETVGSIPPPAVALGS